jgi:multidrug efflux pump subunit AcrA (membrane-fusion protein)
VQAAQANVARLEAMTSFKNLTAPFDGIVTESPSSAGFPPRDAGKSRGAIRH